MARIDLLTAQMCRRAAKHMSVQSDEKMQFFGAGGELLGEGATLSGPAIHEFLLQIAPLPFDGVPVSFPYKGRDGEFKILVAARCRGFEIHALSPTTTKPKSLFPTQPATGAGNSRTAFNCGWSGSGNSYGAGTNPTTPMSGLRPDGIGCGEDSPEETQQDDTD